MMKARLNKTSFFFFPQQQTQRLSVFFVGESKNASPREEGLMSFWEFFLKIFELEGG
jgi:hypothetical protein